MQRANCRHSQIVDLEVPSSKLGPGIFTPISPSNSTFPHRLVAGLSKFLTLVGRNLFFDIAKQRAPKPPIQDTERPGVCRFCASPTYWRYPDVCPECLSEYAN